MTQYKTPGPTQAINSNHDHRGEFNSKSSFYANGFVGYGQSPGSSSARIFKNSSSLDDVLKSRFLNQVEKTTPSDTEVAKWICESLSRGSFSSLERGSSYLMTARRAWSSVKEGVNVNIVAAERFMDGYEGNINEVALGFQYVGKHFRETGLADFVRDNASDGAWKNEAFVMLFGRNGSPASSVGFTTRWGLSGIGHRYMKIKPGSVDSPVYYLSSGFRK